MIEGVLTKIRKKLHDRVVYYFHVSSPKKNQDIQMYGHKVKFMDKISGCYPINNSFEINFKFLNIFIYPILVLCIYCSNLTYTFMSFLYVHFMRFTMYVQFWLYHVITFGCHVFWIFSMKVCFPKNVGSVEALSSFVLVMHNHLLGGGRNLLNIIMSYQLYLILLSLKFCFTFEKVTM